MGDYEEGHWSSVEQILSEAIGEAGFDAKLVSQETASGVIHQRIITNLYTNPLVVCDVSGRNPNVMFELGIRLAFDKPTVIVKDDETPFSFDTNPIEHVPYPKSLKYAEVLDFKSRLSKKVKATSEAAEKDPNYSTFLRHIGGFVPAKMELKEIPAQEFFSKQLDQIMFRLDRIDRRSRQPSRFYNEAPSRPNMNDRLVVKFHGIYGDIQRNLWNEMSTIPGVSIISLDEHPSGEISVMIAAERPSSRAINRLMSVLERNGAKSISIDADSIA